VVDQEGRMSGAGIHMTFFSEREQGERPRNQEELTGIVWAGIQTEILARINDGTFGASYPEMCPDGAGPVGTDEFAFWNAMRARIHSFEERPWLRVVYDPPPILDVMDMIEFCYARVGKPLKRGHHRHFDHYHLNFDVEEGRAEFREAINEIFRRNGLAFDLDLDGSIQRLSPPVLREALAQASFATGDPSLDGMLAEACQKFVSPDEGIRREALERLWDAFERLKTLEPGADKAARARLLLDKAAGGSGPAFREMLKTEALALTKIGNSFQIRHSETTQEPLISAVHVDVLFHRLFAFISLLLRATHRT
jgi:hypothetical protein